MIYYIEIRELSAGSGANFPHMEFRKVSYDEAIKSLNLNLEKGGSQYEIKKTVFPKIISNDTYFSFKFREVFSLNELKKWCGVELNKDENRDFFIDINHYSKSSIHSLGNEILDKVISIIENKISYAKMLKGIDDVSFTERNGETFYSESIYDRGWETENNFNISESEKSLYDWWNSLDKIWKKILFTKFEENDIPAVYDLQEKLNLRKLQISKFKPLKINYKFSSETLFKELDLKPLSSFTNMVELDLSFIDGFQNISTIGDLKKIEILNMSYTNVDDLKFTSRLTNLKKINLSNSAISDLLPLFPLKNFEELDCSYCRKIIRLLPMQNLKTINITGSNLTYKDILEYENLVGYKIENVIK